MAKKIRQTRSLYSVLHEKLEKRGHVPAFDYKRARAADIHGDSLEPGDLKADHKENYIFMGIGHPQTKATLAYRAGVYVRLETSATMRMMLADKPNLQLGAGLSFTEELVLGDIAPPENFDQFHQDNEKKGAACCTYMLPNSAVILYVADHVLEKIGRQEDIRDDTKIERKNILMDLSLDDAVEILVKAWETKA